MKAVREYLGASVEATRDFEVFVDRADFGSPVAVRDQATDAQYLVHAPYTVHTVEEVEFKTWPPTSRT